MIKSKSKSTLVEKYPELVDPGPLWLRIPKASHRYGLSRTTIFKLINLGELESRYLVNEGKQKGIRLISDASLKKYVESFDAEGNRREVPARTAWDR